ncbi:MAG TPA: 2Fe-2S iron-sulfur cluster-binding protein [Nitrospirales bacterium]|jgi:succinate dehydrogenase / fumarate reductase iron-sulfur subunit
MSESHAIPQGAGNPVAAVVRLAVTIQKYNPEIDVHPHDEVYHLEAPRGLTILDALIRIKNEQDGRLTFRYSCRSAICGSCAMTVNGAEQLACRTSVRREWERYGNIRIAPLKNLDVIKDLAVDMRSFWEKTRAIVPWLLAESSPGAPSAGLNTYAFHNVDACIMCGACVAACTSHEADRRFLGPAALAKAYRFVADAREAEDARTARLAALQKPTGMWDCTRCNFCVQVCPKDVQPMEAIIRLRRAAIDRGLTHTEGARHVIGFRDLIAKYGRLNEALMPLKVIGLNLGRFLHILPLGVRMLLKGKVPSPVHPSIKGVEHVRAILQRSGQRNDVSHLSSGIGREADG